MLPDNVGIPVAEKYCVCLGGRIQTAKKRGDNEEEARLETQRRALKLLRGGFGRLRIASDSFGRLRMASDGFGCFWASGRFVLREPANLGEDVRRQMKAAVVKSGGTRGLVLAVKSTIREHKRQDAAMLECLQKRIANYARIEGHLDLLAVGVDGLGVLVYADAMRTPMGARFARGGRAAWRVG